MAVGYTFGYPTAILLRYFCYGLDIRELSSWQHRVRTLLYSHLLKLMPRLCHRHQIQPLLQLLLRQKPRLHRQFPHRYPGSQ